MAVQDRRGAALTRLFQIVTLMYGGGRLTQQDFAIACGCSDRQIRRALHMLEQAGVPFSWSRLHGYRLADDWSPLRLSLTLHEVMALLLARQSIVGRAEVPFVQSAQSAFDKVAALLPDSLRDQMVQDQAVAYYQSGKRDYAQAPWGRLLHAMRRRECLEMDYYTLGRDARSTRRIDPYHIVWLHNFCHLIAYCHTRRKVINFALDSIEDVRSTGQTYEVRPDFSLADHLRGAAGPILGDAVEIRIRFAPEVARWARRRAWEFPHTLTDQADASIVLCGTVRGLDDIRKELLTWGRHACALEPDGLRHALREEARALLTLYDTP